MNLNELLKCDKFQSLIAELKKNNLNINSDLDKTNGVLVSFLKERLKQRQYVLYGFKCVLQSEEETTQWLLSLLENRVENLQYICARIRFNESIPDDEPGEYPPGEEPDDDDKDDVIEVLGIPESSILHYIIELDMVKNHPKQLAEYYKRIKIPRAARFATDIKRLHETTFSKKA